MLYVHLVQETNTNTHNKNQTFCEQRRSADGTDGGGGGLIPPRAAAGSCWPKEETMKKGKGAGRTAHMRLLLYEHLTSQYKSTGMRSFNIKKCTFDIYPYEKRKIQRWMWKAEIQNRFFLPFFSFPEPKRDFLLFLDVLISYKLLAGM